MINVCDEEILKRIDQYSKTQDVAFVEAGGQVACTCRSEYDAVRRLEGYLVGRFYL